MTIQQMIEDLQEEIKKLDEIKQRPLNAIKIYHKLFKGDFNEQSKYN